MTKRTTKNEPVCMCGDLIKDHNEYSGHMPVDIDEYYNNENEKEK